MLHVLPPGRNTGSHEPPVLPPGGTTAHMMAAFWTPALSSWPEIEWIITLYHCPTVLLLKGSYQKKLRYISALNNYWDHRSELMRSTKMIMNLKSTLFVNIISNYAVLHRDSSPCYVVQLFIINIMAHNLIIFTNAISSLRMLHVLPPGRSTNSHEPPVLPPGGTTAHMTAAFWTPALSSWPEIAVDNNHCTIVQLLRIKPKN